MHYKNGREAKIGDQVVGLSCGNTVAGAVVAITPGAKSCNLAIATAMVSTTPFHSCLQYVMPEYKAEGAPTLHFTQPYLTTCCTASDFLHAEDLLKAFDNQQACECGSKS